MRTKLYTVTDVLCPCWHNSARPFWS